MPSKPLSAEEQCLAAEQSRFDGLQAGLNLLESFENPGAVAFVDRRSEEFALADELLVLGDECGQCWGFLPEALGHAVVLRYGQLGQSIHDGTDAVGEAFELLSARDGRGIGERFGPRGRWQELAAVVAFGRLNA
jgi:hypothetical protein